MARLFYAFLWLSVIYVGIFIGHSSPGWFIKPQRSIDFFCWGDTLEAELLDEFEKTHGIKVRVHPFSSNEEMLVKLKAVNGKGYDLVCASDYAVRILKEEKLVTPLNYDLLPNAKAISPYLLNLDFDPKNEVSLPIEWEPYVFVTREPENLAIKDLFLNPKNKRIVMTSDPVEAIAYAAYSLYGKIETLNQTSLLEVRNLLKKQKKSVEAYADHRAKYLIETNNCDLALIRASFARLMQRDGTKIHYSLPTDWHFVNIENLAITENSTKKEDAHKLINFILSYDCQKAHTETVLAFSTRKDLRSNSSIEEELLERNDPQFFRYLSKEEETRDLWVSLKTHMP